MIRQKNRSTSPIQKIRPRLISNDLFPRWEEKDIPVWGNERGISKDKNEIPRVLAAIYLVW